jgi:hypothetical protein
MYSTSRSGHNEDKDSVKAQENCQRARRYDYNRGRRFRERIHRSWEQWTNKLKGKEDENGNGKKWSRVGE